MLHTIVSKDIFRKFLRGRLFFIPFHRRLAAEFRQGFAAVSRDRTARALQDFPATDSISVGVVRLVPVPLSLCPQSD